MLDSTASTEALRQKEHCVFQEMIGGWSEEISEKQRDTRNNFGEIGRNQTRRAGCTGLGFILNAIKSNLVI